MLPVALMGSFKIVGINAADVSDSFKDNLARAIARSMAGVHEDGGVVFVDVCEGRITTKRGQPSIHIPRAQGQHALPPRPGWPAY